MEHVDSVFMALARRYVFLSLGLCSFVIGLVVWIAAVLLSFYGSVSREKVGGFECGFDSEVSSRSPFSLRFFVLLLLFVVFDVEIALLVPCIYSLIFSGS